MHPSVGSSFLLRLVYMGELGGWWHGERGTGGSGLSTHTQGKGSQQIWVDPSKLWVPVGCNTEGFGLCCFAHAAVCSLSCLLPL